jgi:CHAT domain-containing protein
VAAFLDGLNDANIVHYAGHAETDFTSGGTVLVASDGLIKGGDVIGRAQLAPGAIVFLNGCHSGNVSSLPMNVALCGTMPDAWLAAGASSVVACDWTLPDDAGLILSQLFYDDIATGHSVSAALNSAVQTARSIGAEKVDAILRSVLGDEQLSMITRRGFSSSSAAARLHKLHVFSSLRAFSLA